MQRRSFFKSLTGAVVATAVSLRMTREDPVAEVKKPGGKFDPVSHVGEFRWINDTVKCAWTERQREAYRQIANIQTN